MKRLVLMIALLIGAAVQAQTFGPITTSCGPKKCEGTVFVRNDGLTPDVYTLSATAVDLVKDENGGLTESSRPVDVKFDETSGRVSPQETREINWKLKSCGQLPCQVQVRITLLLGQVKAPKDGGDVVGVRVVFPHTIYQCADRAKDCRERTLRAAGLMK